MEDYNKNLKSPSVLITAILALVAWLILFIGGCVAQFHGVIWWIIIYELFFVVAVVTILGLNRFHHYRNSIYIFLAVSLVYLTYLCEMMIDYDYIHGSAGARAAVAGAIILVIMEFLWAFVLTAPEDSFLTKENFGINTSGNLGQRFVNTVRPSRLRKESPLPTINRTDNETDIGNTRAAGYERITALHDYQGSPEDPNELSFHKDEALEVIDKRGNWWQARKLDGTVGIVPSNYFQ
ncbi:hypothetical protein BDB01DRAFT_781349 [Pilobolus umbonatus]|nr:hypothetical protein BDB01DRAFT_781349 [Pilobolus umbonatus]